MRRVLIACVAAVLVIGCRQATPQIQDQDPVRAFVEGVYPHGVPYDKARALPPGAEDRLLRLLDEDAMRPYRSNILIALAMLASPRAAQRVTGFIEAGTGDLTPDELVERLDATQALGYIANREPGPVQPTSVLNYLITGLEAAAWAPRVKWNMPGGVNPASQLRRRAISALGLSGKPAALSALEDLQKVAGGGGGDGGRGGGGGGGASASEQDQIAGAIEANKFIFANEPNGLSTYYAKFLR